MRTESSAIPSSVTTVRLRYNQNTTMDRMDLAIQQADSQYANVVRYADAEKEKAKTDAAAAQQEPL